MKTEIATVTTRKKMRCIDKKDSSMLEIKKP